MYKFFLNKHDVCNPLAQKIIMNVIVLNIFQAYSTKVRFLCLKTPFCIRLYGFVNQWPLLGQNLLNWL
jgi:hypothetical protein